MLQTTDSSCHQVCCCRARQPARLFARPGAPSGWLPRPRQRHHSEAPHESCCFTLAQPLWLYFTIFHLTSHCFTSFHPISPSINPLRSISVYVAVCISPNLEAAVRRCLALVQVFDSWLLRAVCGTIAFLGCLLSLFLVDLHSPTLDPSLPCSLEDLKACASALTLSNLICGQQATSRIALLAY